MKNINFLFEVEMDKTYKNWCDKLLDLGKTNKLINFKEIKLRTLEILSPELEKVFKDISNGNVLTFYDVDTYVSKLKDADLPLHEQDEDKGKYDKISKDFILHNLNNVIKTDQLLSFKKGEKLTKVLNNIKKVADSSITETGVNILYMAFGFLNWQEAENIDYSFKSPILLIPVKLENESPSLPFTIRQYEDEIVVNPTLKYKLSVEFGIELPTFQENGFENETIIDYFERVNKVVNKNSWKISKDVVLSPFSFTKINMYMDMKDNETKILANSNVKKILNKDDNQVESYDYADIDIDKFFAEGREIDLHNVVDADSSQIEAIVMAKSGKSFVLQGPPGTGKSQTITNIIAELLYDDKKVLFVSEKLAALNVVYNNLKRVGLSDYCLELHSNKSNKKDVIDELNRVLHASKKTVKENAKKDLEELYEAKGQLDDYAKILHKPIASINKTPYQIFSAISKYRDFPEFSFAIENIESIDIDYLKNATTLLDKFSDFEKTIGYEYEKNCWNGFNKISLNYKEKLDLKNLLTSVFKNLTDVCVFIKKIKDSIGIDIENADDIKSYYELINKLANLTYFHNSIFDKEKIAHILKNLEEYNNAIKDLEKNKKILKDVFNDEFYSLDINNFYINFNRNYNTKFRILKKDYRKDIKNLRNLQKEKNKKLKYEDAVRYLKLGYRIIELNEKINQEKENLESFIGNLDVIKIDLEKLHLELSDLNNIMPATMLSLTQVSEERFNVFQRTIKEFISFIKENEFLEQLNQIQEYFDINIYNVNKTKLIELKDIIKRCLYSFEELDDWIRFNEVLIMLSQEGLKEFVDESIKYNIPRKTLSKTYKLMFYKQLMYNTINKNPILHNFSRLTQDSAVAKFKKEDKIKFEISKAEINCKLSNKKPDFTKMVAGSQQSVLTREALKKRKQKPVRELLKEISQLIQTLKPCFLMSPLSVSTYLDYDTCKFDTVIFDEASQIFPQDAIGSIARAEQVIVVGDSKQMPPSNFFMADFDDENEDDSLDFESILDSCQAIMEQKWLKWHYRSNSEELIAFSNANFYHNNLITFPSAKSESEDFGVHFYYVKDGIFDRKAKNNRKEAERVVDLIWEHFEQHPERSLGVVSFSVAQQALIEEIISERRKQNDIFAELFDSKKEEPFFVKNLETVQGDERDTIIFSVGYGRDSAGKFYHLFGPLSKSGGERRLNVAITRAKYNVKVVASIKSHDIDLSKTTAIGTKLLKEYLECAEKGMEYLKRTITFNDSEPDSEFEIEVGDNLKNAGYNFDIQVGCSGYKIDIGVKHPKNSDYVLAIECDGATYHSSKTSRERDRLRQEVLEKLGWKFYRIWSTSWFLNKKNEQEKLLQAVEKAIQEYDNNIDDDFIYKKNEEKESFINEEIAEEKELKDLFPKYSHYNYDNIYLPSFRKIIFPLVEKEGPITEELLLKETVEFFDNEKVTNRVRDDFKRAMRSQFNIFKIKDYYVVDKNAKIELRLPDDGDEPRDILMICDDEIAAGMIEIVKNNNGIAKDSLFSTIVKLLGFNRMGTKIKTKFDKIVDNLVSNNTFSVEDNMIFMA